MLSALQKECLHPTGSYSQFIMEIHFQTDSPIWRVFLECTRWRNRGGFHDRRRKGTCLQRVLPSHCPAPSRSISTRQLFLPFQVPRRQARLSRLEWFSLVLSD